MTLHYYEYSRTQLTASATMYPFLDTGTYVCTLLREDGYIRMYPSSRRRVQTYIPVFAKVPVFKNGYIIAEAVSWVQLIYKFAFLGILDITKHSHS